MRNSTLQLLLFSLFIWLQSCTAIPFEHTEESGILSRLSKLESRLDHASERIDVLSQRQTVCRALPREDFEEYATCDDNEYQLMNWCSGDCNADDARVTVCCIKAEPDVNIKH